MNELMSHTKTCHRVYFGVKREGEAAAENEKSQIIIIISWWIAFYTF